MDAQSNFDKTVMDHYRGLRAQGISRDDAISHCSERFGLLWLAMEASVEEDERLAALPAPWSVRTTTPAQTITAQSIRAGAISTDMIRPSEDRGQVAGPVDQAEPDAAMVALAFALVWTALVLAIVALVVLL